MINLTNEQKIENLLGSIAFVIGEIERVEKNIAVAKKATAHEIKMQTGETKAGKIRGFSSMKRNLQNTLSSYHCTLEQLAEQPASEVAANDESENLAILAAFGWA